MNFTLGAGRELSVLREYLENCLGKTVRKNLPYRKGKIKWRNSTCKGPGVCGLPVPARERQGVVMVPQYIYFLSCVRWYISLSIHFLWCCKKLPQSCGLKQLRFVILQFWTSQVHNWV